MTDHERLGRARVEIEDAVHRALEAGMSVDDIRTEVEYSIDTADDS